MFDAELENAKLLCLYSDYKEYNVDCDASDAAVSSKNAGYVSLSVSFLESIDEYNQEWCKKWLGYFFMRECSIYDEYKAEISSNADGAINLIWEKRKMVAEQNKKSSQAQ
ncbi:hypothetical protein [Pleomorphomonas sp. NRK KF1]|uniref:hypothetical protein n=1 Tax=Pleomorphomonas sp. NRK KF1 TaxID=2943000 RepID=UPI002044455F|nr:hypothetical protein [Pleomorphomonas sp. NRK KF1]MCM5553952.1 hypothetical protein [Pleomorphomonas sp. NRK KF1]